MLYERRNYEQKFYQKTYCSYSCAGSCTVIHSLRGDDKKLSEQMGEGFTAAKFKGPEDGSYLIIRYGPDEDGNEKAGSISPAGIFVDMTQ